jgi:hypothetical protein
MKLYQFLQLYQNHLHIEQNHSKAFPMENIFFFVYQPEIAAHQYILTEQPVLKLAVF